MPTALKQNAREEAIRARREISAQAMRDAATGIASHNWADLCSDSFVTCYSSITGEPSTAALRKVLMSLNCTVALPVMQPGRMLAWGWDDGDLAQNSFGILEPAIADIDVAYAKVMFIPALQVGLDGTRLGRGAGYYDRALGLLPRHKYDGPLRVAIAFDHEVVDSVPHEEHDAAIDMIATPTRLITLNR